MRWTDWIGDCNWLARPTLLAHIAGWIALALPGLAWAGADEARQFAEKGAEAFKAAQYWEAAVAFEKAAQLDPSDPKNLRYAGRAWQEVGHLRKALVLLEAYLKIEPDAALKASAEGKIAPLRNLTPLQHVEALSAALVKYPQARLEPEAAKAHEEIGDEASFKKAAELWEVAKVRAASDAERLVAENGSARVAQRLFDLRAKREKDEADRNQKQADAKSGSGKGNPQDGKATPGTAEPSEVSTPMTTLLYGAGGALVLGGAALVLVGRNTADNVDTDAKAGKYATNPGKYTTDRDSADITAYAGWGVAAAGAGMLLWAVLLPTPAKAPTAGAGWWVAPTADGFAVGGSF
ncbi:MAG: hypothetical protein FJ100_15265 [Deltaproteobacteria bacterium]|nr:hypothetical protein [Deltaproteobacteria bacterium]